MASVSESLIQFFHFTFPFNTLERDELIEIIPNFEQMHFQKGNPVYLKGEVPEHFYLLLSGEVTCHSEQARSTPLVTVTPGGWFGEEALSGTEYRTSDAVCETPVTILRVSKTSLTYLISIYPIIGQGLRLVQNTFRLRNRYRFPWLGEGERITLISRRHPFLLFFRVFLSLVLTFAAFSLFFSLAVTKTGISAFPLGLSILMLVLGFLLSLWTGLEWTNDFFILTDERVLVQKKLIGFFDSRQESPMSAVLSTGLDTSLVGRLIGYGTITMRSYTGDLKFKRLPTPELIFSLLESQRLKVLEESKQQDGLEMRTLLESRLNGVPMPKSGSPRNPTAAVQYMYQRGSLLDLLARFFGLRSLKDSGIVYRTHWWILVKKTILPGTILLATFILAILGISGVNPKLDSGTFYGLAILVTIIAWVWWLYQYADWHNDVYIITTDQLVDVYRRPLGTEQKRTAPIKNIQTVQYTRKGLIGLILNYGTVQIQIGNEQLTFDNVYDPAGIQSEIYAVFRNHEEMKRKKEQEKMADWISTYDAIKRSGETRPVSGQQLKKR